MDIIKSDAGYGFSYSWMRKIKFGYGSSINPTIVSEERYFMISQVPEQFRDELKQLEDKIKKYCNA